MDDVEAYYARLREHALRRGYRTLGTFMHAATGLHEKWTQPKKGPTLGELRKIREFLGISWGALLDGAPESAEQAALTSNGSDLSPRELVARIEEEIKERQIALKWLRRAIHQPPPPDAR